MIGSNFVFLLFEYSTHKIVAIYLLFFFLYYYKNKRGSSEESTHDLGVASTCSTSHLAKLQEISEMLYVIIEPLFCMHENVCQIFLHMSILHANVYQEMLVCDSFCVERMNFAEQRVLV